MLNKQTEAIHIYRIGKQIETQLEDTKQIENFSYM